MRHKLTQATPEAHKIRYATVADSIIGFMIGVYNLAEFCNDFMRRRKWRRRVMCGFCETANQCLPLLFPQMIEGDNWGLIQGKRGRGME